MKPHRYQSRVKFFDYTKRYGFILPCESLTSDIFVSEDQLVGAYRPDRGDLVEFTVKRSQRGVVATEVTLVRQRDESLGGISQHPEEL